jgi:hypothetical protein
VEPEAILEKISQLNPSEFENFAYDCINAAGLKNLVWRTPGADGGRDIEGVAFARDLSGEETAQRWYVECKRYATSLDWPTVWEKVAYADVQGADVLLVFTNSNPSPRCESEIASWNASKRRPLIRFWRGYDLPRLVRNFPWIGASYGLNDDLVAIQASALPLSVLISKMVQVAYTTAEFQLDFSPPLEACACLSELLSQRLDDLKRFGRFVPAFIGSVPPDFSWLRYEGRYGEWEEIGLRAVLSYLRHVHGGQAVAINFEERAARVCIEGPRIQDVATIHDDLLMIGHWSRIEIQLGAGEGVNYQIFQRA